MTTKTTIASATVLRQLNPHWKPNAQPAAIDERDFVATADTSDTIPESISLRSFEPPRDDQGPTSSCTGFSAVTVRDMELAIREKWNINGSERYNYFYSRKALGWFPKDGGATLPAAFDILRNKGSCPAKLCPWDANKINETPGLFADGFAKFFKLPLYMRVLDVDVMRHALSNKHPIGIAIPIYDGFWALTKDLTITNSGTLRGWHAVVLVGYDDKRQAFELRNSWGFSWGDDDHAWLPYSYLKTEDFDAIVSSVE